MRDPFTFGPKEGPFAISGIVRAIVPGVPDAAFNVIGGEAQLTILSLPDVTAPTVIGGVNSIQITG